MPSLVLALDADADLLPQTTAGDAWPPPPLTGWRLLARLTLTVVDGPDKAGFLVQGARTKDEAEFLFGWLEDVEAADGVVVLANPGERPPDGDAEALYRESGMHGGFVASVDAE